ncbi:MAG: S1 RNA-binding domain-containing protein, partial [Clostridia bacterium]|nr:S1 RNA-binding domain-containing protein [Clostridia bacterium]
GSYTVFIPASQVDVKKVEDAELETYVGKTLKVSKLPDKDDTDNKRKRIVASHKAVQWAERKVARDAAEKEWKEKREKDEQEKKDIFVANIDRFEVNNVVPGVVKRFTNFGAFVNVYGFDCLAPKGELSWERDIEPSSLLQLGKEYEFVIIKVDPENFKVSLSYKLLQEKPKSSSEIIAEKYHVGMIVKGKVQTLASFGAFVSLEPRIDGLVHVSNMSDKRINAPSDILSVGDEIEAKIINIKDNRIALSIKDVNAVEEVRERDDNRPSRTKKFDKPIGERKPRKGNPNEMQVPKEEEDNLVSYGSVEDAKNTILGDLLKGFEFKSDDDNN